MQKLIYSICLFFLFGLSSKAISPRQIEGLYYSPDYGIQIDVEHHRNKIKVRGLQSNRRWVTYRQIDRQIWRDSRGNEFVLGRRSQFIYRKNRRSRYQRNSTIHFYKSVRRPYYNNRERSYGGDSRSNNRSGDDRYQENRRYEDESYSSRSSISGNWYSKDFRLQMEVESTSNGVRCRLENENTWTYYRRTNENDAWKDNKGNILRKSNINSLLWISNNGQRKIPLDRKNGR